MRGLRKNSLSNGAKQPSLLKRHLQLNHEKKRINKECLIREKKVAILDSVSLSKTLQSSESKMSVDIADQVTAVVESSKLKFAI